MILQANKKFIDTSHVAHLLTAGEKYADKLVFSVERFYQETDLSGCLFVMHGVRKSGTGNAFAGGHGNRDPADMERVSGVYCGFRYAGVGDRLL